MKDDRQLEVKTGRIPLLKCRRNLCIADQMTFPNAMRHRCIFHAISVPSLFVEVSKGPTVSDLDE